MNEGKKKRSKHQPKTKKNEITKSEKSETQIPKPIGGASQRNGLLMKPQTINNNNRTTENTHCPRTLRALQACSLRHSGLPSPIASEHASAARQTPSADSRDANLAVAHRPLAWTNGLLGSSAW